MEPLMPPEGKKKLEDLAAALIEHANRLGGRLHPIVATSIADRVRSMNCYYSNLIEGHDTYPVDIERALKSEFSADPGRRILQLEAKAHIEVQQAIECGNHPTPIESCEFIQWVHAEFYARLPAELHIVRNPSTKEERRVIGGVFRDGMVQVGAHIPPEPTDLPSLMQRFCSAYHPNNHNRIRQIIAVAASHHRLLWIHPFFNGNGRGTRLLSHAMLQETGITNGLWSIARGLARDVSTYKERLMAADAPRRGDLDGRGNLSTQALESFCQFFLETAIDQIQFMEQLLDLPNLMARMDRFYINQLAERNVPDGGWPLLREALIRGEFNRGEASNITQYKDRQSRSVLRDLLTAELLVSDTPKGKVRLGFPIHALEDWLPRLYPIGKLKIRAK
jgi:Fic family protein